MSKLIDTNPYLKDPIERERLIEKSIRTNSAVGEFKVRVSCCAADKEAISGTTVQEFKCKHCGGDYPGSCYKCD